MTKFSAGLPAVCFAATLALLLSVSVVSAQTGTTQFQVTIDAAAHKAYGLFYPVTYMFQIPASSSNLAGNYRYTSTDAWLTLPTRTAADQFNGVPAARFDYSGSIAYLSLPFGAASDSIYLRVVSGTSEVPLSYLGIAPYYDNRQAAVTVTLDDWDNGSNGYFNAAMTILSNAHVPSTVGIITYGNPDWSLIQTWYNAGYMEAASHTRTHTCGSDYLINGYTFQIQGSRDDILNHLNMSNPYVTTFIEPCGYTDAQLRQAVTGAGYLAERGYPVPPVQNSFAAWGGDGTYSRALYSFDTSAWYGNETSSLLTQSNAAFDSAYASHGIYHLVDHPWYGLWYSGSNLSRHVTYISNRNDVWYAPFGGLYLYHFVAERGLTQVFAVGNSSPLPTITSISPSSVIAGAAGFTMTVTGTNFGNGAVVRWNNADKTTTYVSSTQLRASIPASDVSVEGIAAIKAVNADGTTSNALSFVINPVAVTSLALDPAAVTGGGGAVTGTVTLNAPALAGGANVSLASSNPAAASVPPAVSIAAGNVSATFPVTTYLVGANTNVTISAAYGSSSRTATLSVGAPAALSSVTVSPATLNGGANATGTVTLTAAAPTGGAQVTLASSNATVAAAPSSVTVPAGSTSAPFTITTTTVAASTSVTITATYASISRTAALTVTPQPVYSLWTNSTRPQISTIGDTSPIELGVQFRADVAGYITGIRFYKDSHNTGVHYGHVWTSNGTLLGEVLFTNETASGWQTAYFSSPIAIAANTRYVASYHTDVGDFSVTEGYFTRSYYNAPLYAYPNSTASNGVYKYSSTRAFPNLSYQSRNYWVDVVFTK
jgi:hypothetical protein